jgi:DNA-binding NtrC family response regulator
LVEPTLFGHAKGAFTGATVAHGGYFEDAGQGTLFLDEIGELSNEVQAKLLRVLEGGDYARVGDTTARRSKARVLAATHRDLRQDLETDAFRQDLYHRLSVFVIHVPPLRDLGDDRLRLLEHFRTQLATQDEPSFTLTDSAQQLLLTYAFPGNARELRNIVVRLAARYSGYPVTREQLAEELDTAVAPPGTGTDPQGQDLLKDLAQPGFRLDAAMRRIERAYLDAAIAASGGNMTQAARRLGIGRTTLYARLDATALNDHPS